MEKQAEIEKWEETVTTLSFELERRYCQMGRQLLEIAEGEQRQIGVLVDQLIMARRELSKARGDLQCESCTMMNDAGSKYCKRCGKEIGLDEKKGDHCG